MLGYLQKHGIVPAELYTDFELFRNKAVTFNNTVVMFLLAGTCRLSKRRVLDCAATLERRAESNLGIENVIILSDTVLTTCKNYYMYNDSPLKCIQFSKAKAKGSLVSLGDLLDGVEMSNSTELFLLSNDFGINTEALDAVRDVDQYEKDLREKIVEPKFAPVDE